MTGVQTCALPIFIGGKPEDFAAFIRAEIVKWGRIIKEAGIKPQ